MFIVFISLNIVFYKHIHWSMLLYLPKLVNYYSDDSFININVIWICLSSSHQILCAYVLFVAL